MEKQSIVSVGGNVSNAPEANPTSNQNHSSLARFGPTLLERGYLIVPIKRGTKYPAGLSGWVEQAYGKEHLAVWTAEGSNYSGVGIKTRHHPAVDIDVRDESVAAQVSEWCCRNIGPAPVRFGQAPKRLLMYRTEQPFSKVASRTFVDPAGNEHTVEVLGTGQQFVAYATHPGTGRPYRWVGSGPADIDPQELSTISVEQARDLCDKFEASTPTDWIVKQGSRKSTGHILTAEERFALFEPPLDIDNDQIEAALDALSDSSDDYRIWIDVGMALHHQYGGGDEGFGRWDAWSSSSGKYKPGEMRSKWESFDTNPPTKPLTFASVLHMAKQCLLTTVKGTSCQPLTIWSRAQSFALPIPIRRRLNGL